MDNNRGKSLVGMNFGHWTVVNEVPIRRSAGGYRYWNCQCVCGTFREVSGANLLNGQSKSCNSCANTRMTCPQGHAIELWGRVSSNCKGCLRERHLKRRYGITLEEFDRLYEYQKGKCAICKAYMPPFEPGSLYRTTVHVDHDHSISDKRQSVRGLLCGTKLGCNYILGKVDSLYWLISALEYIIDPPAKEVLK